MFVVPLAVPKVFAVGDPSESSDSSDVNGRSDGNGPAATKVSKGPARRTRARRRAPHKKGKARRKPATPSMAPEGDGHNTLTVTFDKGDESEDKLPKGLSFDWQAYKDVLGDTPYEDAVTAMFAEYATLYSRVAGWTTSRVRAPMTMEGAKSLSDAAVHFIRQFVRPLMGQVHTPKIRKLLRHILDAIRLHGNLRNGNTNSNEAGHKTDKRLYGRTNKAVSTFTAQIAQQSQGSQAVLARSADVDADTNKQDKLRRVRRTQARGGKLDSEGMHSVRGDPLLPVGALAMRPGLGRLAAVLRLGLNVKVPVLGRVMFFADLNCGTRLPQTLRASMNYLRRGAWLDAVTYTVAGEPLVVKEDSSTNVRIHYGEVRALIRYQEEDVALVCDMEEVDADKDCPLAERECIRLKWAVPASESRDWSLTAVPMSRVRRVIHVSTSQSCQHVRALRPCRRATAPRLRRGGP